MSPEGRSRLLCQNAITVQVFSLLASASRGPDLEDRFGTGEDVGDDRVPDFSAIHHELIHDATNTVLRERGMDPV